MEERGKEIKIVNYEGQDYYDLLDIDYNASPDEIKRAYQFQVKIFSGKSMAIYSLFTPQEREKILSKIEEAYKTLMDTQKRKNYDEELIKNGKWPSRLNSKGLMKGLEKGEKAENKNWQIPVLSEEKKNLLSSLIISIETETGYNGPALRKIRELKGISLEEISSKTKINKNYLNFIEEERYEFLPPEVYVKGFLSQIAKILGLDPRKVTENYMDAMRSRKKK